MAKEENDLMDVKIQSILRKYQEQVSELTFQSYIKDEQINNLQTKLKELQAKLKELQAKLKELQAPKSAKEAKK